MAKCPKCGQTLNLLKIKQVPAETTVAKYKAIIFSCPSCGVAIGAQIDPILLADYLAKTKKKT
jgi:predicted RNA-binding Zn-ribbon protein involved in translation (DUF1610 family)